MTGGEIDPQQAELSTGLGNTTLPKTSWIGLTFGSLAILVTSALLLGVLAAVCFGGAFAVYGYASAIQHASSLSADASTSDSANFVVGLAAYVSLSAAVLIITKVTWGGTWRERIAWQPWSPFHQLKLFAALFVGTLIYSFAADRVVTYLHPEAQSWMPTPHGPVAGILFVGLAALLAPVGEELLFRGWLYTGLRSLAGVPSAIGLSAGLFAIAHWEETHLYALAVFPIGLALGFIRERTGSIKASIAFHAIYNGFAAALLLTK